MRLLCTFLPPMFCSVTAVNIRLGTRFVAEVYKGSATTPAMRIPLTGATAENAAVSETLGVPAGTWTIKVAVSNVHGAGTPSEPSDAVTVGKRGAESMLCSSEEWA